MEAQAASAGPFPVSGLTPPTKRTGVKRRIGDVIVQLGFAERELVERVVENGRRDGLPLGQALIEAGVVNSAQLAQALAERNGLDYVDLNVFDVDKGATAMIDSDEGAPLPDASRSPSWPSARCSSRPPTPRTCSRSTTSRWPPATRCAAPSPRPSTSTR